jgi:hypothetical protein
MLQIPGNLVPLRRVLAAMEVRKQEGRNWSDIASQTRRIVAPVRHEGVGNALRSVFLPRSCAIPQDMAALLAQLD